MSVWRQLFTRRMLICVFTGFSSGLPLYLLFNLLPAWLRSESVDLKTIGLFALIQFPYTWKFLWSPLLDRYVVPVLGRRRGWMLLTQLALLLVIALLGAFSPQHDIRTIAWVATLLALLSATQDIALDAYRRELLPDSELGLGNSVHVNAYRVAGLVPGALSLILADHMPWNMVFVVTALFMLPGVAMTLLVSEPHRATPPRTLREAVVEPFHEFITRQGWQSALLILAFLLFYKLGDSMCTALATPFYLDMGYSKTDIGLVATNAGLCPSVIGGLLGGIRAKMAGIAKWVQGNIVNPVVTWVKHWFGIKSPSTVMHGIGLNLVAGLLRGLATTDGEAVARTIFGSLPKALASIVSKGLVSVASLPGRALKALGGLGGKILSFLGIGTGGGGGPAVAAGQRMAAAMGWTGANWQALKSLWMGESGWNPRALNQSSGAYGIPQSLPASKMASAGADWRTNPATQIRWGLAYIRSVYGSPLNAYRMWLSRSPHWYGHGGPFAAGQLIGVGDRGPELVSFSRPGRVLSPEQSAAALSGGEFTGNLYLDSGQFLGLVRGEITAGNRKVLRAARAGAGLAR